MLEFFLFVEFFDESIDNAGSLSVAEVLPVV